MQIEFSVDNTSVFFSRSWFTGESSLVADGKNLLLEDPKKFGTHFSLNLIRTWHVNVLGHEVVIEKVRPQLVAGLRPQTYRIFVDGQVVAEKTGY